MTKIRKYKKLTTTIDEEVIKKLKREAVERDISVGRLVEELWKERNNKAN